ncbi:MAG: FHA domain-containing protein [Verrucomicrobiales bacterium]|nr:FHA domain-containing protein [Verrucomicrobiales bacterium]MCP5526711.1 FHA domain-containing protein [Verrucomicrobiales bacterium]
MAKLVVLTEGFAGTSFELKSERTTIGRLEDNLFPIAESSISGHHCEVLVSSDGIVVKDLNSTNGTFINGKQISQEKLKPGQVLRLGQIEMRLENGAGSGAAPKKSISQTMPIQGGLKLDDLEGKTRVMESPFKKKSNKTNKIFLFGGIGLGVVIVALIIYAITQLPK